MPEENQTNGKKSKADKKATANKNKDSNNNKNKAGNKDKNATDSANSKNSPNNKQQNRPTSLTTSSQNGKENTKKTSGSSTPVTSPTAANGKDKKQHTDDKKSKKSSDIKAPKIEEEERKTTNKNDEQKTTATDEKPEEVKEEISEQRKSQEKELEEPEEKIASENGKVEENGVEEEEESSSYIVEEPTDESEAVNASDNSVEKKPVRLIYFDGQGRAELARLIMAHAAIDYEDLRVTSEQWESLKPCTPFGQLPVLEWYGQQICQSLTIARFLAKKAGLYGQSEDEAVWADMMADCAADFNNKWVSVFRAESYDEQMYGIYQNLKVFAPSWLENAEKVLEQRGGKYFAGDEMTYGDIAMFNVLYNLTNPDDPFYSTLPKEAEARLYLLDDLPLLRGFLKRIWVECSGIKNWIQNRPEGLF